ncbi:protein phosphatase 1 regulatory subunit SDS22-like, partial [Salvia splendens]|uniref:protein phosphatase 1 regulatory subunit SDS22-like n=1 Tax=Salvia splendens TaxID=180675 RepID=UPI001C27642E
LRLFAASLPSGNGRTSTRCISAVDLQLQTRWRISHTHTVIRSLTTNSSVAHITGLGLAAIPSISQFSSLRSVNLSCNLIVRITPGSLPKGLHVLNLSRNNISTIEGLRDLTRLRVLDLSYSRISRIGQGMSNCTLVKELYLAGNKISTVEGLHRLLKLTVLDLSFNKITAAKGLGQLVANYSSLIAVNLLGNPVQSNMSDELMRKTVCSLLPKLALLNRHPVNPQKAREIRVDSSAKAALGGDSGGFIVVSEKQRCRRHRP